MVKILQTQCCAIRMTTQVFQLSIQAIAQPITLPFIQHIHHVHFIICSQSVKNVLFVSIIHFQYHGSTVF